MLSGTTEKCDAAKGKKSKVLWCAVEAQWRFASRKKSLDTCVQHWIRTLGREGNLLKAQ